MLETKSEATLIERLEVLRSERRVFEPGWREISKFMRPVRDDWRREYFTGERPEEMDSLVTDSVGMTVLDNFVGGAYSFLSNEANQWFGIRTFDDDLNNFHSVKTWLKRTTHVLLRSFSPAMTAFYAQAPEIYADTPAYGTGIFFSEWRRGERRIFDTARSIFECYIDVNQYGEVDTLYRRFSMTGRQLLQKFGDKVTGKTRERAENSPKEKIWLLHAVYPNEAFDRSKIGLKGFALTDRYVDIEEKVTLGITGRIEKPFQAVRWAGTGKYGFGLGRRHLPDIKMVNAMKQGFLETLEWQNHPTTLLADEDELSSVRPVPRGLAFGGLNSRGDRRVDFLAPPADLPFTAEAIEQERQQIRDAWVFSLMQIAGRTGLNEVETLQLQEDKMRLMGPSMARQQNEFLSPLIKRRFAMLNRHGQIDEPPPELEGEPLEVFYTSPMAQAQKFQLARSTLRLVQGLAGLAELNPEVRDLANTDAMAYQLMDGYQADPSLLFSPDEVEALREQRANERQIAAQLEAGQQGAEIAQTLGLTAQGGGGNAA